MKYSLGLLILFAGTGVAQWRHFGDALQANAPRSPFGDLAGAMVSAHNAVRATVGTHPLRWSDRLASVAQKWADGLLADGQFVHSHNPKYGENLYEITGAAANSAQVVKAWADEARDFRYSSNSCSGVCGHFTQVVWRDTKEVGCAVARGGPREVWVCEYDPPGNWAGEKPW
jgi:pathogenesis-related protein 1